jgi:hypothetical protein
MRRLCFALLITIIVVTGAAWAKEGGDQYPNGAESWFAGAAPPSGFYYINYFGYYTGQLKDGAGRNVLLNGATPQVNATFDALRFLYMTHLKLFGADYGMHVIVPVVYQSMNLNGRASNWSVGDITIDPFILAWNRTQWHAVAAMDVDLPSGSYQKTDPRVSIGANYYTFEPVFAFSYTPKSGWEASAKLMYDFHTTNWATDYHSGQEFHMDYLAGKHLGAWMFGGSGYFLEQVKADTVNGRVVPAVPGLWDTGRRGQVLAFGPSAGYENKRHMVLLAQWQHETVVRNRFGGDKFWFKVIIPVFNGGSQEKRADAGPHPASQI